MTQTTNRPRGYIYTLLATLSFSNVYIFSKAAMNQMSMSQFWFFWFLIAVSLNLAVLIFRGKLSVLRTIPKKSRWLFPTLGAMEIATTTLFFASIKVIENPAVTGFLGNLFPLFVTLMGVVLLKERFTRLESAGIIIVLLGAFVTSYSGSAKLADFFIPGTGLVVLNALFAAATTILVKVKVKDFPPELLNFNRTFWLFLFAIGWIIVSGDSLNVPGRALLNTGLGAFFGPFLAVLLVYKSYQHIEASRSSIIQALKGLFVMGGVLIYFGQLPQGYQIFGGILSIVGVIVMASGKLPAQYRDRKARKTESGKHLGNYQNVNSNLTNP